MFKKFLDGLYNIYEIIFTNISFFSFLYLKFHEPSVKKEIKMAEISESDKILHIGCGAIPYSLVILSNEINTEVCGIDNQPRSINLAKKFLTKHKKHNKICVEMEPGETYNVSNFDVILVSYGVGNIEAVLKNVFSNLKNKGKIILRKPITEKNEYVDSIIEKYSIKKIKSLLTQESILITKN